MPSGTLTRKIARQPSPAIRTPPSDGPRAVPIADIVPSSPMALPVLAFGTVSPTKRHGEGHHDGRAEALRRPGGNQQPERGRDAAQDRGHREQDDSGQQQPPAAGDVAEPSDADDQGGDGEEIGEDDPLDFLEGGVERLRQRRQGRHWRCWCRARTAAWRAKGWRAPTEPKVSVPHFRRLPHLVLQ